jgi:hypothetical protein
MFVSTPPRGFCPPTLAAVTAVLVRSLAHGLMRRYMRERW